MEALRAHDAGIIMLAVGVGTGIDQNELEAIASEPICLHLFLLRDFNEVDELKYAIEKRTCEGNSAEVSLHCIRLYLICCFFYQYSILCFFSVVALSLSISLSLSLSLSLYLSPSLSLSLPLSLSLSLSLTLSETACFPLLHMLHRTGHRLPYLVPYRTG